MGKSHRMVYFCMTLNGNHHPKPIMRPPIHFNTVQLTIGIAALAVGVLVYALDRADLFHPGHIQYINRPAQRLWSAQAG